ncbi:hypothetical protein MKW98_009230 [Papaver atlanticum]|uniref:RNB domain-containing protein n=1 Tax=Papaver atlanticum TaxID=357466 RepID=A0AAD4T0R5_9MAGN|nr:hypothetical protein MKW98_009230 [Papaver atlanticum]
MVESNQNKEEIDFNCLAEVVLRFTNALGAMIYPIYGQGELPQAFFRCAAVKCALYINLFFVDICSLRSDIYTQSVIKSCAALSYIEAQARMDDSCLMDSLTTDLRNMNALAKIMRLRRIERGALTLASAEADYSYFNKLICILTIRCTTQMSLYTDCLLQLWGFISFHQYSKIDLNLLTLLTILITGIGMLNQMVGRASVELHTLIYFRNRPTDTEARIVKIRSNGFIVFVPKYAFYLAAALL